MSFIDIDIRQKQFTTSNYLKVNLGICRIMQHFVVNFKELPLLSVVSFVNDDPSNSAKTFPLFRTIPTTTLFPQHNESTLIIIMSTCKICDQNLTIELDPEEYYPSHTPHKLTRLMLSPSFDEASGSAAGGSSTTVPDDLQLTCSCHFHW